MTLETEANISCVAVNQVGQGKPDFIAIQVIGKFLFYFWRENSDIHFFI